MSGGYVYVLSNTSMPGLLKIGRSNFGGAIRAHQLSTKKYAAPFKLVCEFPVENPSYVEAFVHQKMRHLREGPGKETFRISADEAAEIIKSVPPLKVMAPADITTDEVRAMLNNSKGSWPSIAKATKVGYFTISKIASGTTTKPHERTVIALNDYFRKLEARASRQAR